MMHDAWAYLVLAGCGVVVFDPEPRLLYRQHSANVIGVYDSRWQELRDRLRRQVRSGGDRALTAQAEEARRLFEGDLTAAARGVLDRFLDSGRTLPGRVRYALRPDVARHSVAEDVVVRVLYLLGRL